MTRKSFRTLSFASAIAVVVVLTGAITGLAGEPVGSEMGHAGMDKTAMMEQGMMTMHKEMQAKMQAMDQKLDTLVAEMDSVDGRQKTDAVAAVVNELVSQRKAMHSMMAEMRPQMMGHMMKHMSSGMMAGMMKGMQKSMADCPMMKQMPTASEQAEEGDHSAHHPEG